MAVRVYILRLFHQTEFHCDYKLMYIIYVIRLGFWELMISILSIELVVSYLHIFFGSIYKAMMFDSIMNSVISTLA